jgi:DNA-binding NtrC family response regulator
MKAVKIYKKDKENIDLVLLDLIMPKKSGSETFDELKKIDPKCKIIITSGYAQDTNTMEMIKSGACNFVQKPYNIDDLSQKIESCLKRGK